MAWSSKDTESENLSSEEDRKSSRSQRSSKELMCILVLVLLCLSVVSSLSVVYSDWWMLAALFPPLATTNLVQAEPVLRLDVAPLTSYGSDVHVKLERLPTIPNAPAQEAPFESLLEQFPPRGVADGTVARSRRRHDDDQRSRLYFPFGASPSLQHISRTNISLLSLARDNNQPKKTPASPEHRWKEAQQEPPALDSSSTHDNVYAPEAEMPSTFSREGPATDGAGEKEARR
ncbi:uncharacterized protein LOC144097792 [Amblyomma americanum]